MTLPTSFCIDSGQIRTGVDGKDTYIKMLQQIIRVTAPIANGIVAEYPTVSSLVEAFREKGPLVLQNIKVSSCLALVSYFPPEHLALGMLLRHCYLLFRACALFLILNALFDPGNFHPELLSCAIYLIPPFTIYPIHILPQIELGLPSKHCSCDGQARLHLILQCLSISPLVKTQHSNPIQ